MMLVRAEKFDLKEKIVGSLLNIESKSDNKSLFFIIPELSNGIFHNSCIETVNPCFKIKPETIEIFIFGQWILYSELETKYELVEKQEYEQVKNKAFMYCW